MNETKNIKAVSLIADKKDYRKPFTCVNFTGKQAVATDGFIIAITDCDTLPEKRYCEPYQKMKKNDLFLGNLIKNNSSVIEPKFVECEYPSFEGVIPKDNDNDHLRIGLSVSVVEKLIKSIKASGTNIFEINFSSDPVKPIIVYSKNKEVKYVLMPAKLNDL